MMHDPNSHLIYSTDKNAFPKLEKREPLPIQKDTLIRLEYQTHRRKGKGISLVIGLKGGGKAIASLAVKLKKQCGCVGTVKQGIIEIQGDKIAFLKKRLDAKGLKVKLVIG
ncbi:stress response translation initiation inhibitor YciH [Candidatus Williamhamiltonella defendens]|uniref:stress response translation initiation inhibitor YciH n=1 Tax=Candidatus Williamhamiltonella defendens TaxID=138072 RepID=UPI00130DCE03|nr:stress response translation initiation inhibitor YciH [Candidatus Hamiltonella defensa]